MHKFYSCSIVPPGVVVRNALFSYLQLQGPGSGTESGSVPSCSLWHQEGVPSPQPPEPLPWRSSRESRGETPKITMCPEIDISL